MPCDERTTSTPDSSTLRFSMSKNAGSSASVGSAFWFSSIMRLRVVHARIELLELGDVVLEPAVLADLRVVLALRFSRSSLSLLSTNWL